MHRNLEKFYMFSLIACIVMDGGAHYLGAAISLLLFSITLLFTYSIDIYRRELKLLRFGSLTMALYLTAYALWQVYPVDSGGSAHPVWALLGPDIPHSAEVRGVNRWQPLWEIPGLVLPFVAIAAGVALFRRKGPIERLTRTLVMLGLAFSLYGLLQKALFPTWHLFMTRNTYVDSLTGFYVYRNASASFLFMTAMANVFVIDSILLNMNIRKLPHITDARRLSPNGKRFYFYVAVLMVQFICLFLTKSRGGFFLATCGLIPFAFYKFYRHTVHAGIVLSRRKVILISIAMLLIVSLLGAQTLTRLEISGLDDEDRLCIYKATARLIYDNIQFGVGFGGFGEAFPAYRRIECGAFGVWETAHDTYLQGLATMGLGFLPALIAPLLQVVPWVRRAMNAPQHRARVFAAGTAVLMLGLALHSLVDFPLEIPGNAILLGLMITMTIGLATEETQQKLRKKRTPAVPAAFLPR